MRHRSQVLSEFPKTSGVLVTAGEKGAAYCFKTTSGLHSGFVPAFEVNVVDTTGAGDAFTSGFIYQMLKSGGFPSLLASAAAIDEAVRFASACGGLTASAPGAIEAQPAAASVVVQLMTARS